MKWRYYNDDRVSIGAVADMEAQEILLPHRQRSRPVRPLSHGFQQLSESAPPRGWWQHSIVQQRRLRLRYGVRVDTQVGWHLGGESAAQFQGRIWLLREHGFRFFGQSLRQDQRRWDLQLWH